MTASECPQRLVVCTGKHCVRDKGFEKLLKLARRTEGSLQAPCQSVCDGPVVAVQSGGEVRWFEKVRSKSLRKRLASMVDSGQVDKDLAKREVKKRRNVVRGGERRLRQLDA